MHVAQSLVFLDMENATPHNIIARNSKHGLSHEIGRILEVNRWAGVDLGYGMPSAWGVAARMRAGSYGYHAIKGISTATERTLGWNI
jgi:hypothetical protein